MQDWWGFEWFFVKKNMYVPNDGPGSCGLTAGSGADRNALLLGSGTFG